MCVAVLLLLLYDFSEWTKKTSLRYEYANILLPVSSKIKWSQRPILNYASLVIHIFRHYAVYKLKNLPEELTAYIFRLARSIAESEREGTRAETRTGLSAKRTSPFKSAGGSVQSTTG